MADQLVNFRFVPCKRIRQFFRKRGKFFFFKEDTLRFHIRKERHHRL